MRTARGRRLAGALLAATVISLAACGRDAPPPSPATGVPPTPSAVRGPWWLAVVEVAPLADDLDPATARLRDALGLSLVVSPADCFEGLPDEAGQGYVIGALADTRQDVERLLDDAGERPLFVAPVTILCSD